MSRIQQMHIFTSPMSLGKGRGILGPTSVTVRATAAAEREAEKVAPLSFGDLGLIPELQAALVEKGITVPTEIQVTALKALLHDRASDFMLASHTGSGKTLAYLLPISEFPTGMGRGARACCQGQLVSPWPRGAGGSGAVLFCCPKVCLHACTIGPSPPHFEHARPISPVAQSTA
jgi:hypothetical protein